MFLSFVIDSFLYFRQDVPSCKDTDFLAIFLHSLAEKLVNGFKKRFCSPLDFPFCRFLLYKWKKK